MPCRFEVRSSLLLGCAAALVACNAISGVDDFEFATGGGGQGTGGDGGASATSAQATTGSTSGATTDVSSSAATGATPVCSGTPSPCEELGENACDVADCDWSPPSKTCSGTADPCNSYGSQGKCEAVGCVWTP